MANNMIPVQMSEAAMVYPPASLTGYNAYVNLGSVDSSTLELMREFKLKEEFVVQHLQAKVHSHIRKEKNGKERTIWWVQYNGERMQRKSYADIIIALYEQYAPNNDITVRQFYEVFKSTRENDPNITSRTVESNDTFWRCHIMPTCTWLDKPIRQVTIMDIDTFFRETCGGHTLTKKDATNIKAILSRMWALAVNRGCCADNVPKKYDLNASGISFKQKKMPSMSEGSYTNDEAKKLIEYLTAKHDKTVYELGIILNFCLDVRIGELRALRWDDLDFTGEIPLVRIQHQIVGRTTGGKKRAMTDTVCYTKRESEAGHRLFPLSGLALQVINELRVINGDKDYILNSSGDLPISENRYNKTLKECCIKLGITPKSSHKIRFFVISSLYDSNMIPEKDIQMLSGHSSILTTRHYNRRIQSESFMQVKAFLDRRFAV